MAAPVTREELRDEIKRLEDESQQLVDDWKGRRFDEEAHARFNVMQDERNDKLETLREIERREEIIGAYAGQPDSTETGATFHTRSPGVPTGEDIYNVSDVRRVWGDPSVERAEFKDRGLRAIEEARFPHLEGANREEAQAHLEKLMDSTYGDKDGAVARHYLATGSREYKDMFAKAIHGLDRVHLNEREQGLLNRAMSLSGASGGVAVPFVLDPTLLPSYNGAVNPYRNIADVSTIAVDEWRGVTSGGITAAYQAEAAATTDQSPTLASVSISTEMARVNIPYSHRDRDGLVVVRVRHGAPRSRTPRTCSRRRSSLSAPAPTSRSASSPGQPPCSRRPTRRPCTRPTSTASHDALPPICTGAAACWPLNNADAHPAPPARHGRRIEHADPEPAAAFRRERRRAWGAGHARLAGERRPVREAGA